MAVEQAAPAAFQQAAGLARARFHVELKAGETTFVSWKKLIKDYHRAAPPAAADPPLGAHPALQARIAPEVVTQEDPLPPPPNRFNSVIEKIERIYKGNDSSDENDALNDFPDDDQYDTEDSFIDDRELNEYFSVDKAKLKHEGFFINRGRLEWEVETAPTAEVAPKKRKRRDVKKLTLEASEVKRVKGTVHSKDAARKNTGAAVGLTDTSDMELVPSSTSNKQRRKKEAQDCLPKQDRKGTKEQVVDDHDNTLGTCGSGSFQKVRNSVVTDKTEIRQSGDAAERSHVHVSPMTTGEMQLFDASDWEDFKCQREPTILSLSKVKSAHKGNSLEGSREASGPTGGLKRAHAKPSPSIGKEISPVRPKGAAWERAFQDLERAVGQLCPPSLISQEPEQGKRNRLPPDVKLKLAKVARLAAKQGQLTDELIDRLMGILGHVVHVKTLKRNMKEMIETGLSALQEKEGRVQDIKREVTEMVKLRVHSLQAQDLEDREPLSDDFQQLGGSSEKLEGRYRWDHATEDKICDLYEQYIEGLEENRGPQIRKLYGELAELWPDGWMDNNGIKNAVQRAKERKKKQLKASIVKSESKKRQRSNIKPLDVEGTRFPLLDLNLPGTEQSSFGKVKGSAALHPELNSTFVGPVLLLDAPRTDHLTSKVPGKGFDGSERKRNKMDGNVLMKKKVKRKLEKGAVILSSHAKLTTSEYPLVQPLVALPARPMEQHQFLQQGKEWATEHIN